jgi:hypothetical protein
MKNFIEQTTLKKSFKKKENGIHLVGKLNHLNFLEEKEITTNFKGYELVFEFYDRKPKKLCQSGFITSIASLENNRNKTKPLSDVVKSCKIKENTSYHFFAFKEGEYTIKIKGTDYSQNFLCRRSASSCLVSANSVQNMVERAATNEVINNNDEFNIEDYFAKDNENMVEREDKNENNNDENNFDFDLDEIEKAFKNVRDIIKEEISQDLLTRPIDFNDLDFGDLFNGIEFDFNLFGEK